jgi:hypothetical protein
MPSVALNTGNAVICEDFGIARWVCLGLLSNALTSQAVCDETFENEKPASVQDIQSTTQEWMSYNISNQFDLADCACCGIPLSEKSTLKICNRVRVSYKQPWLMFVERKDSDPVCIVRTGQPDSGSDKEMRQGGRDQRQLDMAVPGAGLESVCTRSKVAAVVGACCVSGS